MFVPPCNVCGGRSALGAKRTCPAALAMSAIGGKAAVAAAHPGRPKLTDIPCKCLIGPGAAFVASATVGPVVRQIVRGEARRHCGGSNGTLADESVLPLHLHKPNWQPACLFGARRSEA